MESYPSKIQKQFEISIPNGNILYKIVYEDIDHLIILSEKSSASSKLRLSKLSKKTNKEIASTHIGSNILKSFLSFNYQNEDYYYVNMWNKDYTLKSNTLEVAELWKKAPIKNPTSVLYSKNRILFFGESQGKGILKILDIAQNKIQTIKLEFPITTAVQSKSNENIIYLISSAYKKINLLNLETKENTTILDIQNFNWFEYIEDKNLLILSFVNNNLPEEQRIVRFYDLTNLPKYFDFITHDYKINFLKFFPDTQNLLVSHKNSNSFHVNQSSGEVLINKEKDEKEKIYVYNIASKDKTLINLNELGDLTYNESNFIFTPFTSLFLIKENLIGAYFL